MTSRVSHCLLVAALAFLVLPSYGTAQAPRRPSSPTRRTAPRRAPSTKGVTTMRMRWRTRWIRAIQTPRRQGASRDCARALPAGRGAAATGCRAPAVERGGAGARAAATDARAPDATAMLEKVAPLADTSDDPVEMARAGARAARARPLSRSQCRVPRRLARRAQRRRDRDGVRRAVPGEVRQRRGAEVVSDGAADRPALDAGDARIRAHAVGREPAAGDRAGEARARDQPVVRRRLHLSRRARQPTPTSTTRRDRRSTRRWRSTRRASAPSRCAPRCRTSRTNRRSSRLKRPRLWRSRRVMARSTGSPAISRHATTASTRRSS